MAELSQKTIMLVNVGTHSELIRPNKMNNKLPQKFGLKSGILVTHVINIRILEYFCLYMYTYMYVQVTRPL